MENAILEQKLNINIHICERNFIEITDSDWTQKAWQVVKELDQTYYVNILITRTRLSTVFFFFFFLL